MTAISWRRLPIEAVCARVTSGGTPLRSNLRFYDGGSIPWVKTGELKDWYIDTTEEMITEEAIERSSAKLFPKETVLMAMYGDGRTITSLGILRHKAASNQACCAMIADPSKCHPLFLFYSLKAHRHALLKLAYGGAQRNLNAKTIRQFEISVPSLPVQERIVSILSAYDDLIENNTRRIKILEDMAQMLYRECFVNFRFPGHEKVRLVESELGPIPEGWTATKLGDVLALDYGKALKEGNRHGGPIPVYGSSGVVGYHSQKLTEGPGIIVGRKGNVGSIFRCQSDFWAIDTAYYVRSELSLHFLYFNLRTQNFLNNDAAVPGLNRNQAYSLPIVVPEISKLESFDRIVGPIFDLKRCLEARNANLRTSRDFLLPKLISGEIPVVASDEAPADLTEEVALHA